MYNLTCAKDPSIPVTDESIFASSSVPVWGFNHWERIGRQSSKLLPPPPPPTRWARGTLEVVFEAVDPVTHEFSLESADVHRVGGRLLRPPGSGRVQGGVR